MKGVIFDMDGTLMDSVSDFVDTINEVAYQLGYKQSVSREQIRGFSSHQLLSHLGVPFWKVPFFINKYRELFASRLVRVHIYPDLKEVLVFLSEKFSLFVVSSNKQAIVDDLLIKSGVKDLFVEAVGGGYFTKHNQIKKIIKKHSLSDAIYVGDESRDIQSAKRADISSCAVTWGIQSEEVLLVEKPDFIARTPHELKKIILLWDELSSAGDV